MRCVMITASDDRMDCRDSFFDAINPLPRKCTRCGFPDLDHVPLPYFLIRPRTLSPNELALAENGNFLIRERVRRVLELCVPDACDYFPTHFEGTSTTTPWWLAVPRRQAVMAKVNSSIPRCEACGEPRSAHPGTQWTDSLLNSRATQGDSSCELGHDIQKSATWGSSERGWDRWISRDLLLSVRLLHLLRKLKAKGFYQATCGKPTSPDKEETTWIKHQVKTLEAAGVPLHAEGTLPDDDANWLRKFMKVHSGDFQPDWDVKAVERRIKAKLPKSYVDFVRSVGPISFERVDEYEGFTATILRPNKLRPAGRAGDVDDVESTAVNGLTFATTAHGDDFRFDVRKGRKEYAVYLFKHEYNLLEPYADNFAACIRRLVGDEAG